MELEQFIFFWVATPLTHLSRNPSSTTFDSKIIAHR